MSTLCPVQCQSFSCRESGVVGIPDTANASPIIPITSGVFCTSIPGATGEPVSKSTVVLLTPKNAAACAGADVYAQPLFESPPIVELKWSPYLRYVVGQQVYGQSTLADPYSAYVCIQDIPLLPAPPTPNPYPPTNASYWTKLVGTGVAPVLPWSSTAGYAPSMFSGYTCYVAYQGKIFALDATIPANPSGNVPPLYDDLTWDLVPTGFQVVLSSGVASGLHLYNYFVMDTMGFPDS